MTKARAYLKEQIIKADDEMLGYIGTFMHLIISNDERAYRIIEAVEQKDIAKVKQLLNECKIVK